MAKGDDKLLSLTQAAERCGYEVSALRRLAGKTDKTRFPADKIGNQWVIAESKLEKWMNGPNFRKKQGRPKKPA